MRRTGILPVVSETATGTNAPLSSPARCVCYRLAPCAKVRKMGRTHFFLKLFSPDPDRKGGTTISSSPHESPTLDNMKIRNPIRRAVSLSAGALSTIKHKRLRQIFVLLAARVVGGAAAATETEKTNVRPLQGEEAIGQLKKDNTYKSLTEAFVAAQYAVESASGSQWKGGSVALAASNPAQSLRTIFTGEDVRVQWRHSNGRRQTSAQSSSSH